MGKTDSAPEGSESEGNAHERVTSAWVKELRWTLLRALDGDSGHLSLLPTLTGFLSKLLICFPTRKSEIIYSSLSSPLCPSSCQGLRSGAVRVPEQILYSGALTGRLCSANKQ